MDAIDNNNKSNISETVSTAHNNEEDSWQEAPASHKNVLKFLNVSAQCPLETFFKCLNTNSDQIMSKFLLTLTLTGITDLGLELREKSLRRPQPLVWLQ